MQLALHFNTVYTCILYIYCTYALYLYIVAAGEWGRCKDYLKDCILYTNAAHFNSIAHFFIFFNNFLI